MTENKSKSRKGEDGLKKVLSLSNPEDVRKFLTSLRPLEQVLYEQARENAEDATKLLKAEKSCPEEESGEEIGTKTCQTCGETFSELFEQRQHFKLDWHRFNIKQKLSGEPSITEQEFDDLVIRKSQSGREEDGTGRSNNAKVTHDDDLASLSGSESEADEEESDSDEEEEVLDYGKDGNLKVFMVNRDDNVVSFHKCVCMQSSVEHPIPVGVELRWGVLMLGGGHFAGAVFHGDKPVIHKTFHCYTVRAKQGGGQSSADNRSGTSHPKSAGASLRRYNEASLAQHVRDIMDQWSDQLKGCSLIFYRAAGNNKKVLFASPTANSKEKPILERRDPRVRSIPFPTRRATFSEVKRIHSVLVKVEVHGPKDDFVNSRCRPSAKSGSPVKQQSPRKSHIHRSKSRDKSKVKPLTDDLSEEDLKADQRASEEEGGEVDSLALEIQHQRLVDGLAEEFETKIDSRAGQLDHDLVTSCMTGNRRLLLDAIQAFKQEEGLEEGGRRSLTKFLNQPFGASKSTALHLAAKNGNNQVVAELLDQGSDPTLKDRQKKTAYTLCPNKETRNSFRRFQAQNQDAFDWQLAQVPTNDILTPEEEARIANKKKEKRKAQKQAKKAKDQEVKKAQQEKVREEKEKDQFLKLSDREKRALAAERRLLAHAEDTVSSSVTVQRCFLCGKDITGKVPFEYSGNRFCAPACVRQHRHQVSKEAK